MLGLFLCSANLVPHMRAAAIFGPRSSEKDLKDFRSPGVEWVDSLSDADAALVFGGDGTVHRHLSALVERKVPVLVVPHGSGNDFARALGLRGEHNSLTAWKTFLAEGENVRKIDLGTIELAKSEAAGGAPSASAQGGSAPHRHYFCCVAGCGIDGAISHRAAKYPRWLRRHGGYALALLLTVVRFKAVGMRVLNTTPGEWEQTNAGPALLATFANVPAYGGGMKIAPRANLDDGKLDVCIVRRVAPLRLLWLFPTVYFGRHLSIPEVDYFQAERVRLETEQPQDVYADGEYVGRTPVEFGVERDALSVIIP